MNVTGQLRRIGNAVGRPGKEALILLLLGTAFAVLIRVSLLDFKSADFLVCLKGWYWLLRHQGFGALRQDFSDYNVPYLYVLFFVGRWLPHLPPVEAIKIPSILGDLLCAGFVYKIVQLKRGKPHRGPIRLHGNAALAHRHS